MRELANAIHMAANHAAYFPHWSRGRYGRLWIGANPYQAIIGCYRTPSE